LHDLFVFIYTVTNYIINNQDQEPPLENNPIN
jgi:hypothetical protein